MHRNSSGANYSRRIVIAVAAALIPLIAGCEAGFNAPILHWHQPTDGTTTTVGNITITDAFVLGAPIGSTLRIGQNAGLFFGLANVGTSDRLVSISAPGVARSVLLPAGQIPVRSQHVVLLTGPRPAVVLQHLLGPLAGSSVVTITFTFAVARSVTLKVPVIPRAQFYTTLSPAPQTTSPVAAPGGQSPSSTTSPSGSPSPSKNKHR